MSKFLSHKCKYAVAGALVVLSGAFAEDVFVPQDLPPISLHIEQALTPEAETLPLPPAPAPKPVAVVKKEAPFSPFTGKVKGRKVRMRLKADLDSNIVKELSKSDLVSIVGEKENFWAVEAPSGIKGYVFRSFVLDNVVEGSRVNVRLEPSLDAPVIAQLNVGDKVNGTISAKNNKWLEIAAPTKVRFYVAKDYIEFAGGPELKAQMDNRRTAAEQLLDAASMLSAAEVRKSFEEMDIDRISKSYHTIINDYSDFAELVEQAKESLASLQEAYMQKRIAYQETLAAEAKSAPAKAVALEQATQRESTDRMKLWEPVEESLYLTWSCINNDRNINEFYEEQKLSSVTITGIVEPYTAAVKNKPGDFILRDKDMPVAYVYSTQVNLQDFVGKKVTLVGTQRPNNNFAFPAYFVLTVQ